MQGEGGGKARSSKVGQSSCWTGVRKKKANAIVLSSVRLRGELKKNEKFKGKIHKKRREGVKTNVSLLCEINYQRATANGEKEVGKRSR